MWHSQKPSGPWPQLLSASELWTTGMWKDTHTVYGGF